MQDELYPWEECREKPYPEEEDFDLDQHEDYTPCYKCIFRDSIMCDFCTEI